MDSEYERGFNRISRGQFDDRSMGAIKTGSSAALEASQKREPTTFIVKTAERSDASAVVVRFGSIHTDQYHRLISGDIK